jgi:glycosyltransferase involved in cell wall biosynthesis
MTSLISVIFPVYNAEKYLRQAVDSVLFQTYSNFEFLIYNDGSTDSSLDIIKSYIDPRIRVIDLERNIGLIKLLNLAFNEAKGKYIARMDADDICLPNRFEEQVKFLEAKQEIGICGTYIQIIDTDEIVLKPTEDKDLRWWIFKGSPFAHPSIMLRKEVIERTQLEFNPNAYVVEDFEFWWQLAFHTKLSNLDQVLLKYRIHDQQESTAKKEIQYLNFRKSQSDFITKLGVNSNKYIPEFIDQLLSKNLECTSDNFIKAWNFFEELFQEERAISFFGKDSIESQFKTQCQFLLQNMTHFNLRLLAYIFNPKFHQLLRFSNLNLGTFFIKSILRWRTKYTD